MKAEDYPIEHFKFMNELAVGLAKVPAQILEHNYIYESFGSWWFTCRYSSSEFRVVFDGKETMLAVQKATESGWMDLISNSEKKLDAEKLLRFILEVFKVAGKRL
jgi:hypothetical protein